MALGIPGNEQILLAVIQEASIRECPRLWLSEVWGKRFRLKLAIVFSLAVSDSCNSVGIGFASFR